METTKYEILCDKNKMKLYSIISMFFINLALIGINYTPTATSYEISIFSAYPVYVWISLFAALALGIIIILDSSERIWKMFGVLISLCVNLIFLLLPFLRNYALYNRSDVISHFAYIKEIILTNHLVSLDYYPISHILVANTKFFTNANIGTIMNVIPATFFVLYFVGLYLFAREISSKRSEATMILVLGSVLMFSYYGTTFLPTQLSFCIIPLLLFVMFRSKKLEKTSLSYNIIFVILLMLMPFFHPLTSINLIFFLIIIIITTLICSKKEYPTFTYRDFLNPLSLVFVSFLAWISSKTIFNTNIVKIYHWLAYELGTPMVESYQSSLLSSNLGLMEVIKKIFLTFGNEIIYILIAIVALGYFAYKSFKKRKLEYNTVFLSLGFITFTLVSMLFFLGAYGFSNPLREFVYVLFFATLINGIFVYQIGHNFKGKLIRKYGKYFLVGLIISCSVIGLYSSYASVSTGETNIQVTNADFTGMGWFYSHKNPELKVYDLDRSSSRFSDVYDGISYTEPKRYIMFKLAPYKFNFTTETGYLVLNRYVIDRYTEFWPNNPYFSKSDFNSLDNNKMISKIYDSSNNQIWMVK